MYVVGNPKTKKALRAMIAEGHRVTLFSNALGEPVHNGHENVEGPHFPKPHTWYARVKVVNGEVTKVIS